MKKVLFLCTGNFYRSRFAEVMFNHLAREAEVEWVADSCGLRVRADGVVNTGAMSCFAREGLQERGIAVPAERWPRQVTEADLVSAEIVIALKDAEHRPLMETQFPEYASRVRYWTVHDLDVALPMQALPELDKLVRQLLLELE